MSREWLLHRRTAITQSKTVRPKVSLDALHRLISSLLDDRKAEDIVTIDLAGKADFADQMIVATGTSQRHVASIAEAIVEALKHIGFESVATEGLDGSDWVLVDAGDIIVHLFRPEARARFNLEKMWSVALPEPKTLELAQ